MCYHLLLQRRLAIIIRLNVRKHAIFEENEEFLHTHTHTHIHWYAKREIHSHGNYNGTSTGYIFVFATNVHLLHSVINYIVCQLQWNNYKKYVLIIMAIFMTSVYKSSPYNIGSSFIDLYKKKKKQTKGNESTSSDGKWGTQAIEV